jgi:hypothetical protein
MAAATERRLAKFLPALLAGLQAGMVGVWWMLAWMGADAVWQRRSFWTPENLMASVFYGDAAVLPGFGTSTVSGLALYVSLYSLLGAGFAMAATGRVPGRRLALVSIAFALCWYYAAFHVAAKAVSPLIPLLDAERTTALGHLIYGTLLARFPVYLPHVAEPPAASLPEIEGPDAEPVAEAHSEEQ